jgi:Putative Ig domain
MQALVHRFVIAVFTMAALFALSVTQSLAAEVRPATGKGVVIFKAGAKEKPQPRRKRRVTTQSASGIVVFRCPDGSSPRDGTCERPAPRIVISPPTLPDGEVDYDYRSGETPVRLVAEGGTAPYRFRRSSGQLPPGLRLSSTGRISGSPVAAGSFKFTVRAIDKNHYSGTRTYTVLIVEPPPPCDWPRRMVNGVCKDPPKITLLPRTLPEGEVDYEYRLEERPAKISARGGKAPYRFRVAKGRLPPGLRLSSSGVLNGTPVRKGTFSFSLRATDRNGIRGRRSYKITILEKALDECLEPRVMRNGVCALPPTISISPSELRGGDQEKPYPPVQFVANGGRAPHQFSIAGGSLPPGLQISATGLLSGTPTEAGAFGFTVQALDRNQYKGTRAYSVTILEKQKPVCVPPMVLSGDVCIKPRVISISPAELRGGNFDTTYPPVQLVANGGARPYSFALASGKLPPGLNMSSLGLISGVPVETGAFSFVIRVSDALDYSSQRTYSITIQKSETKPEACPPGQVRFGANCEPVGEQPPVKDPPRIVKKPDKPRPCGRNQYRNDEGRCVTEDCGRGKYRNSRGKCVRESCPRGKYRNSQGNCAWERCGRGKYRNNRGKCVWESCPRGKFRNNRGKCVGCGRGKYLARNGKCAFERCSRGKYRNNRGICVWEPCNRGYYRNNSGRCVRERCPRGTVRRGANCIRVRCNQHYVPNNQGRCVLSPYCVGKQLACVFKKNRRWIPPCTCQKQYREQYRERPRNREGGGFIRQRPGADGQED